MKILKIALLLGLISPISPAYADLQGKVEFVEPEMKAQTPKLDRDHWEGWRQHLKDEIASRTRLRLKVLHMPPQGSLELHLKVTRQGEVQTFPTEDASSNLGLVTSNVVQALEHTSVVKFPETATETEVLPDLVIETISDDSVRVEFKTNSAK